MTWHECAEVVRAHRISSELSYSQLEDKSGVSIPAIMSIEKARGSKLFTLRSVCEALGLKVMCAGNDLSKIEIGDLIRECRLKRKIYRETLAKAAGVSFSMMFYLETGATDTQISKLFKVLEALDIELSIEEA